MDIKITMADLHAVFPLGLPYNYGRVFIVGSDRAYPPHREALAPEGVLDVRRSEAFIRDCIHALTGWTGWLYECGEAACALRHGAPSGLWRFTRSPIPLLDGVKPGEVDPDQCAAAFLRALMDEHAAQGRRFAEVAIPITTPEPDRRDREPWERVSVGDVFEIAGTVWLCIDGIDHCGQALMLSREGGEVRMSPKPHWTPVEMTPWLAERLVEVRGG